jgi:hypothetical protein
MFKRTLEFDRPPAIARGHGLMSACARLRASRRVRRLAVAVAALALAVVGVPMRGAAPAAAYRAAGYQRQVIYRSPQQPGYTCWTGAWVMPDGDLMVSFTRATGPVEGRPRAPRAVLDRLVWPPNGDARYDMTGLDLRNVHLRSKDGGQSWQEVGADPFRSPMNGVTGEAEMGLPSGTLVRGLWGFYLPFDPELPPTGLVQRSSDGGKSWGKPAPMLAPRRYTAWPKRLRRLRDGRLIATGGVVEVPAGTLNRTELGRRFEPLLTVSRDSGKRWGKPIPVVPPEMRSEWGGEEYDAAELENGDLLCVFRRLDPKQPGREVRWQGRLRKSGRSWVPADVKAAPFPHSGHPELLAAREGVVLHLATRGIHLTADGGKTWRQLEVPGTSYYPRSVQALDGTIYAFGHIGGDDGYGAADQAIVMDRFRLVPE